MRTSASQDLTVQDKNHTLDEKELHICLLLVRLTTA